MRISDNRDNDHAFHTTNRSRDRQRRAVAVCFDKAERNDATVLCHLEERSGVGSIAHTFGLNSRLVEMWSGDVRSRCSHVVIRVEAGDNREGKGRARQRALVSSSARSRFELGFVLIEKSRVDLRGSLGNFTLFFLFDASDDEARQQDWTG